MQGCEVVRRSSFKRSVKGLSSEHRERVEKAIVELSRNPYLGEVLKGRYRALRRYRVGKYRIVYDCEPCRVVFILVEHRETVFH